MSFEPIRKILVDQRHAAGTTLRELQASTGLSNGYISQIENGRVKRPSFETVVLLARALELDLCELIDLVPTKKHQ